MKTIESFGTGSISNFRQTEAKINPNNLDGFEEEKQYDMEEWYVHNINNS